MVEARMIRGQNFDATRKNAKKDVSYEAGDPVWVYQFFRKTNDPNDLRIKKLASHWHGPYRVVSRQGHNTYRVHLPTHPDKIVLINIDRLKPFRGYWSRPYDHEVPYEMNNPVDQPLEPDQLPPDSFVTKVEFSDGDVSFTNVPSPVRGIVDKRRNGRREVEFLVEYSDGQKQWTSRSLLKDYGSFITEYENKWRERNGLPLLRRSSRVADLDVEPNPRSEF
ncbi:unnamed protein product [Aphanomyces euteiches]